MFFNLIKNHHDKFIDFNIINLKNYTINNDFDTTDANRI